ncbi:MAG: redoxin domain-containing protein [Candidatus Omnitrophica bacterium]|nr:redoxin domain-containing protein [Candidatus Omnitrophota bacterium]
MRINISKSVFLLVVLSILCISCRLESKETSELSLVGTPAPRFAPDAVWINVPPGSVFERKPTLLYFWSSSSINAIRALKIVNRWYQKYSLLGLEVIGVHAPQFTFEKDAQRVETAISTQVILHPVVLDNDFRIWTAYRNRAWPTFYLVDHRGIIREIFVGEVDYDQIEVRLQDLLIETGAVVPAALEPLQPEVDFSRIGTPQILTGFDELSHFGSPEPVLTGAVQAYSADVTLQINHFYLVGDWEIQKERALLRGRGGKLLLRFEASRVYAVLGSLHNSRLRAEVRLDGEPLTTLNYGKDVWFRDGRSYVEIDYPRLYELVDTRDVYDEYTVEISFLSADSEVYSLMFG